MQQGRKQEGELESEHKDPERKWLGLQSQRLGKAGFQMYSESTADGFAGTDERPESSAREPGLSPEAVRPLEDNPSPMTV